MTTSTIQTICPSPLGDVRVIVQEVGSGDPSINVILQVGEMRTLVTVGLIVHPEWVHQPPGVLVSGDCVVTFYENGEFRPQMKENP